MTDTPAVVVEAAAHTRSRRKWFRWAVVSAILLLLFGVPWWTLSSAGRDGQPRSSSAGTVVFVAASSRCPR